MPDRIKICMTALILALLPNLRAFATESTICTISASAVEFADSVTKSLQPLAPKLWQSYPQGFAFGFVDFDSDGSIYLLKYGHQIGRDKNLKPCPDKSNLLKSTDILSENLASDGRVFYCGPNSLTCDLFRTLTDNWKSHGIAIMAEKISKKQFEINLSTFPSLERFYSQSDISAYLSLHEMFHVYQMKSFKDFHREYQGTATTAQCFETVPSWSRKLRVERELIERYLNTGYSPSKEQAVLFVRQLVKIREANGEQEQRCREILVREERLEGAAHFIGNLFLEKFKNKSLAQMISVDRLFLSSNIETINWLHGYVSGNLLIRALAKLDPMRTWEHRIEAGESPFDVANEFTSKEASR